MITRRSFLTHSAVAVGGFTMGRDGSRAGEWFGRSVVDALPPDALAAMHAAVAAAIAAGASYADVRYIVRSDRRFEIRDRVALPAVTNEDATYGVRALVDGAWGFASGQRLDTDSAVRVGRGAVRLAQVSKSGGAVPITLAPAPVIAKGEWHTPIEVDPFETSPAELSELLKSYDATARAQSGVAGFTGVLAFRRIDTVFVSSEGSVITQRRSLSDPSLTLTVSNGSSAAPTLTPVPGLSAGGWGVERLRAFTFDAALHTLFDAPAPNDPPMPVDTGRYDVVFSAAAIAEPLVATLGRTLELDRALGDLSDADGGTFAGPPSTTIGKLKIASRLITVTGDRTRPGGLATTGWDDDGVAAPPFTFIDGGLVTDYVTTRETAASLEAWYRTHGTPLASRGCANAEYGSRMPEGDVPNLTMSPGTASMSFDDLVADTKNGIAVMASGVGSIGSQRTTADYGNATLREIRNGRLGRAFLSATYNFRTLEFWRSIDAIGGANSVVDVANASPKGDGLTTYRTVSAVPVRARGVTVLPGVR